MHGQLVISIPANCRILRTGAAQFAWGLKLRYGHVSDRFGRRFGVNSCVFIVDAGVPSSTLPQSPKPFAMREVG